MFTIKAIRLAVIVIFSILLVVWAVRYRHVNIIITDVLTQEIAAHDKYIPELFSMADFSTEKYDVIHNLAISMGLYLQEIRFIDLSKCPKDFQDIFILYTNAIDKLWQLFDTHKEVRTASQREAWLDKFDKNFAYLGEVNDRIQIVVKSYGVNYE